jgi:hypothetical protein
MNILKDESISCPYCGETIEVLIDCSVNQQRYIEDCQVCCRPITISVDFNGTDCAIAGVATENDV